MHANHHKAERDTCEKKYWAVQPTTCRDMNAPLLLQCASHPGADIRNITADASPRGNMEQMICCADLLDSLCAIMVQEPFKLLVVDSIMANLRTDYVGRGELSERQQRLGQYLKRLKQVCGIPSSYVQSSPRNGAKPYSDN
jgi:hypothetical protein